MSYLNYKIMISICLLGILENIKLFSILKELTR